MASNKKARATYEGPSSDRIAESDVAEETMSAMVKLAKDQLEPYDIGQPTAECQLMTPSERSLVTQRDELRPVQGRAEDTDECVMTSHTKGHEVTSVEEGHDVEFGNCAKESQEAKVEELQNTKASLSGSLTKSKEELASSVTSAAETAKVICSSHQNCDWNFDTRRTSDCGHSETQPLDTDTDDQLDDERIITVREEPVLFKEFKTTLEKKGLDRKTNHHDLTKTESEEIFVLSKAIQENETVALKLEQSAKAVEAKEKAEALPRPTRPPPWRDKFRACQSGASQKSSRTTEASQCYGLHPRTWSTRFQSKKGWRISTCLSTPSNSLWEAIEMKARSPDKFMV